MADGGASDMNNVARVSPEHKLLSAPAGLRALPGWLCWRAEANPSGGKPIKVPYWASGGKRHGRQGGPEDRSKLVTFPAAVAAAQRLGMDGVGFAPLPDWGIVALDFDNCVDPAGHLPPEVSAIVKDAYSEFSPSGQGVRTFMRGDVGNRKSLTKGNDFGFETFSTAGFVTLTGNALPHVELLELEDVIPAVTTAVLDLCEKRFGSAQPRKADPDDPFVGFEPRLNLDVDRMEDLLRQLDPDTGRDEWIRVGMALHHETEGDDTGFALWNDWSALGLKYPGEEALQQQWDSFTRRAGPGQRQVTMASVIKMANESTALTEDELRAALGQNGTQVSGAPRTPDDFDGKFKAFSAADLSARPPIEWLVKGILPRGDDPVVIFGAPSAGKSFVALDIAAAIARGIDWYGRRVKKGRVVIVAAEGSGGVPLRLRAYLKHHGLEPEDLDIAVIDAAPNLMNKDDVAELVKTILALGDVLAVIIDTFAQTTPGANENAGEDMSVALANAKVVSRVTNATTVLIHHSGKDASKGARGWSGIKGAAAAQLEVIRHEDGQREIFVEKMKDGKDGDRLGFKLEVIDLGMDADGDPLGSLVVAPAELQIKEVEKPQRNMIRRGRHERHVLEMIELEWSSAQSENYETFVVRCADALPPPDEGKRDNRRFLVTRALNSLAKGKEAPIAIAHGRVVFCE